MRRHGSFGAAIRPFPPQALYRVNLINDHHPELLFLVLLKAERDRAVKIRERFRIEFPIVEGLRAPEIDLRLIMVEVKRTREVLARLPLLA